MHLSQMFPSRNLVCEDLAAFNQGVTSVTIEKLDYQTFNSSKPGEAEIGYFLHFREFKKPMRLNKTCANLIADLLGTKNTDDWLGKVIGIQPIYQRMTDQSTGRPINVWLFNIDAVIPPPPQMAAKQDITGLAATVQGGVRPGITAGPSRSALGGAAPVMANPNDASPMGLDKAAAMLGAIGERGKTCDDLIKHMAMAGMSHLVAGKIPPEWPVSVIPTVHGFCRSFPKVKPPADAATLERFKAMWSPPASEPPTEVVDRATGEVTQVAGRIGPEPINEEDIPF